MVAVTVIVRDRKKTIVFLFSSLIVSQWFAGAATGNLFPYKISWLMLPQESRKVEMIQHFPDHYGAVTTMVAAAVVTGRMVSIHVEMVAACRR